MNFAKGYRSNYKSLNREIALIIIFLLDLMISTISNYNTEYLFVKAVFTSITIIILFFDYRKNRIKLNFKDKHFNKFISIIITLIIFPAVTILYSHNAEFGLAKLLYLVISTIPVILFFYYLLLTWNTSRLNIFYFILISIGIIGVSLSLILKPFEYELYKFSLLSWSHVIFGRYIGAAALISFFLLINARDKTKIYLYAAIAFMLFIGTYYTALRASALGLLIFSLVYLIYSLIKQKGKYLNIAFSIILILAVTAVAFIYLNFNHKILYRYNNLTSIESIENDSAIGARLEAYKTGLEKFEESPIIGLGFGGFKSKNNIDITALINYPHNLFIEVLVEFGIIGFILFSFLVYLILKHSYKISFEVFLFFLFMMWLGLFSKDLPTNSMFLMGIAFIGLHEKTLKTLIER